MRIMLVTLALAGLVTVAVAEDEKKLSVGDAAPAIQADKWLQGDEVKKFEKDRVYVVEFWATWCGPCIVMMPHMSDLQQQYKKDVTFVGFSSKDPGNTEEKVVAFVKKRGPKLKYTFAYEDGRATNEAWMKAAGRNGIPCSFVVDRAGKIAFIGHPMYLDTVLPKVVSGKWDAKADGERVAEIEKEVSAVFKAMSGKDSEAALDALATFEKNHKELSGIPYFTYPRLNHMLLAKKTAEAKKHAETVVKKATAQEDPLALRTVSMVMRSPAAKDNKDLLALSLSAAEALLKTSGDKDASALLNLAETHFARGEKDKAKEAGQKALDAAENPNAKRQIAALLKKLEDDTKKDD